METHTYEKYASKIIGMRPIRLLSLIRTYDFWQKSWNTYCKLKTDWLTLPVPLKTIVIIHIAFARCTYVDVPADDFQVSSLSMQGANDGV